MIRTVAIRSDKELSLTEDNIESRLHQLLAGHSIGGHPEMSARGENQLEVPALICCSPATNATRRPPNPGAAANSASAAGCSFARRSAKPEFAIEPESQSFIGTTGPRTDEFKPRHFDLVRDREQSWMSRRAGIRRHRVRSEAPPGQIDSTSTPYPNTVLLQVGRRDSLAEHVQGILRA